MAACQAAIETEVIYCNEMRVGLIFCFGRDLTWEANTVLAAKTRLWRETYPNLVGIDLAPQTLPSGPPATLCQCLTDQGCVLGEKCPGWPHDLPAGISGAMERKEA